MKPGQLSENFYRYEFACHCGCGFDAVDAELIRILEDVRAKLGNRPITITSGCRCMAHNEAVGGAKSSVHMTGKAVDFVVEGVRPDTVADCLEDLFPDCYGIGRYPCWTHFDVRPGKARWDKR